MFIFNITRNVIVFQPFFTPPLLLSASYKLMEVDLAHILPGIPRHAPGVPAGLCAGAKLGEFPRGFSPAATPGVCLGMPDVTPVTEVDKKLPSGNFAEHYICNNMSTPYPRRRGTSELFDFSLRVSFGTRQSSCRSFLF